MRNILAVGTIACAFALTGLSSSAQAAEITTYCPPDGGPGIRQFSVTTDPGASVCYAYGNGNINGNPNGGNPDPFLVANPTFILLDKSDDGVPGGPLGIDAVGQTFTIALSAYNGYNLYLGLKSGNGQFSPDWAVFRLPTFEDEGSFTVSVNGFSHANLYGQECGPEGRVACFPPPGDEPSVPEPTALALLGLGLLGAGVVRRRM